MHDKTFFITGATGFLGSYLLRYLVKQGYTNIRALRRADSSMALVQPVKGKVEWIEGDLMDIVSLEGALRDVNRIYHCAATVSYRSEDNKALWQTNSEGTANIVNAALNAGVEKLLHVSSVAAIGRNKLGAPINEQTAWERDPLNTRYAISKYLAEQEVWRGMAEGLPVAIINPSVMVGSGFWHKGPARLFQRVWNGLKYYPAGGNAFVDVRDVARLCIRIMESNISGERFICCAENLSYQALLSHIAEALDKPPPSRRATPLARALAWRAAWMWSKMTGKAPLLTRETAMISAHTFSYDNRKSIETFDFQYTPLQQTIRETARQFKESQQRGDSACFLP